MNSTEASTTTEWSSVPDAYEVEIKASPKFPDINLNSVGNDTANSNNDTLTFQGESLLFLFIFYFVVYACTALNNFCILKRKCLTCVRL